MSLAVCMIACNEAARLPRALHSISASAGADQVIVADTGSTDQTPALARNLGATVIHIPWQESFSLARKASFAPATTDWILWLDADETLDAQAQAPLHAAMQHPDIAAHPLIIRDHSGPGGEPRFTDVLLPRLFRRQFTHRLTGRIHEHFDPPLIPAFSPDNQTHRTNILIHHDGYTPELQTAKLRRNAHLLELEMRDHPESVLTRVRHARTLFDLSDPGAAQVLTDAATQLGTAAQAAHSSNPDYMDLLEALIVRVTRKEVSCDLSLEQLHELSARWFPASAQLLWLRANWHYRAARHQQAAQAMETLVRMGVDGSYDKSRPFDCRIVAQEAVLNLGICFCQLRRWADARNCFSSLLSDPAYSAAARQNLALLAHAGGP